MEKIELICIGCPIGCQMTIIKCNDDLIVEGNQCKRGATYGKKEVINPTRIVTTTIPVIGGASERVSVKTQKDIPKDKITQCLKELKNVSALAPIHIGDVIIKDIANSGVDIIATKEVLAQ